MISLEKEKLVSTLFGKPRNQVVRHPGALKRAAKKAGQTTHEYEEQHKGDSGTSGRRARLALTFAKMRHGR